LSNPTNVSPSTAELPVTTVLVDQRNFADELPAVLRAVAAADFLGIDTEFHDSDRHAGLKAFCKYDDEGFKAGNSKLVFDNRRIVTTGFSVHPEGSDTAWYFNLNHADVENRLPWAAVKCVLEAKKPTAFWLAHNAPIEITVFKRCYDFDLKDIICTLQLAVSCYANDEYNEKAFNHAGLGAMGKFMHDAMRLGMAWNPDIDKTMPPELDEILYKITAKESKAAHSYNGWVKNIAYQYNLKDAVRIFFDRKMTNFKETLGENAHMGQLTGEQTVAYGAEDAYWVVPLFRHLMAFLSAHAPNAIGTFFTQENPMAHVFADVWQKGMRVNFPNIETRRIAERSEMAHLLRDLKAQVRSVLPFPTEPCKELIARGTERWYADPAKDKEGYKKYRASITEWALSDDSDDDFEQCWQIRGATGNAWAVELGRPESTGPNLTHYMPMRTLLYDLLGAKLVISEGKVQSDGECRGKLKEWFQKQEQTHRNQAGVEIIELLNKMASSEQRMKLYLTPYMLLTDPETQTMYPVLSCMLATRRMAASYPNPMQLAKRGESTYVRGFFLPDAEIVKGKLVGPDDHLIVSLDWSAFELVIVGELSKDPEFHKAFHKLPHEDLHSGAAASILQVEIDNLTETMFKGLKKASTWDEYRDLWTMRDKDFARLSTNLKGEAFSDPSKGFKYWRTELGKGANFNYWYSGFLATIGERMGWSMDKTGEATDLYRQRFSTAEAWRIGTIEHLRTHGWVELPDGHRRYRFEATERWMSGWLAKWRVDPRDPTMRGYNVFVQRMAGKISRRAANQGVNALVQGTNAFITKRSVLRIRAKLKEMGWTDREARFMISIHDEVLFSVRHDLVVEFIQIARQIMSDYPDIFPTLKLDATPAVGLTFEPWDMKKAPIGQVELFEPPAEIVGKERAGQRLDPAGMQEVVDYLQELRMAA
jgi:DNA polymerase I-like protein with 3'-5' exonuclease and polymerase domains